MSDFNKIFYEYLMEIQEAHPDLIPPDIDVTDAYAISRSFRRGATTRAQVAGVPSDVVDWVNRWGTGQELVVKGPMRVVYTERRQMVDRFLSFSREL